MVSTYTPNINLELQGRGDNVGTWDTGVNADYTLIDLILGGQTTISGAAGSVVLAAAQFQCKTITFNSTLLASIVVTFPTSFMKSYEIYNTCTGSSAFVITLQTTAAGVGYVCAPPGEIVEIVNIAGAIRFKNLGRVGDYWDYAGSSVPAWVSESNPPPYLACTAVQFSSTTYPVLATILGSTTTPDQRGRARVAADGGAGRLSSAVSGFDPNATGAGGGAESVTLATSQIPAHTHSVTDPGHFHPGQNLVSGINAGSADPTVGAGSHSVDSRTQSATTGITIQSAGGGGAHTNLQPTMVGGLVMIRAG